MTEMLEVYNTDIQYHYISVLPTKRKQCTMRKFWSYFVLCGIICAFQIGTVQCDDSKSVLTTISEATLSEDGKLNFIGLVNKYGHSVEQHEVVTEDGYILTVFRIPGEKPPILLFHGIIDSCDTFVIRGNISLAITLANAGHDVFVGNHRGNLYGRHHVSLDPDTKKKFWEYSFHEIGYYDLAATINFVRNKTGAASIATIGHSEGTTAHFVLTSLRPEYNDMIKVFIAMSPVVFLNSLQPPLSVLAASGPVISAALQLAGMEELLKDQSAASDLIQFICTKGLLSNILCNNLVLYPGAGYDPEGNNDSGFLQKVAFGHYPRATSRKSAVHYAQLYNRKRFAQYDYGQILNLEKYGSLSPPDYDLSAVTTQVALLVGKNDAISKIEDVDRLYGSIPNAVNYQVLDAEKWNHVDFVWGKYMPEHLYPIIFQLLEKYYTN